MSSTALSKGKSKVSYLGDSGVIDHSDVVENGFLYSTSSERDRRYHIGDRVVTQDGRVFRYAKFSGNNLTGFGSACTQVFLPLTLTASPAIGSTSITVTLTQAMLNAAGDGTTLAVNALRGGLFIIHTDASDKTHNGTIIGNTSGTVGQVITIFLDRATVQRTFLSTGAAAGYVEVMASPYLNVSQASDTFASVMGLPAAYGTNGQYGWLQTWGPVWIVPGGGSPSGVGIVANGREVYFVGDHSINALADLALVSSKEVGYQRAGFIIQKDPSTPAGGGPPFVMLQISI